MDSDLSGGGVPDGEKLGEERERARNSTVITAKLDEEKDAETRKSSNGGDVEEILDVAVPCEVVKGGRRRR